MLTPDETLTDLLKHLEEQGWSSNKSTYMDRKMLVEAYSMD